ncbi:MAG TPA: diacylglycerol kinase family protein [Bryobacterales bacterium]|nr:diacylglycerol kinase family protein [Bryobacterales bacterium]
MYRRAVLIYNPAAGRGRARRESAIDAAMGVLAKEVEAIDRRATSGPGSATELAREASRSGADLVLVCGGDGTIHEAANGLAHTATPLGVLPAGTGNVLALEAGLPRDPVEAAALLPRLEARRIGLGRICRTGLEPRWFLLLAGAGLDAQIIYSLNPGLKGRLGVLAYWLTGMAQIGRRLEEFEVTIGEQRETCTFALATHCRTYGGNLRVARRAHLLNDELEVVLFRGRSGLRYLPYLAGVLSGRLDRLPGVTFSNARRLEMRAAETAVVRLEADGEYIGRLPATIEIVPEALTILLPPGYLEAHG